MCNDQQLCVWDEDLLELCYEGFAQNWQMCFNSTSFEITRMVKISVYFIMTKSVTKGAVGYSSARRALDVQP